MQLAVLRAVRAGKHGEIQIAAAIANGGVAPQLRPRDPRRRRRAPPSCWRTWPGDDFNQFAIVEAWAVSVRQQTARRTLRPTNTIKRQCEAWRGSVPFGPSHLKPYSMESVYKLLIPQTDEF